MEPVVANASAAAGAGAEKAANAPALPAVASPDLQKVATISEEMKQEDEKARKIILAFQAFLDVDQKISKEMNLDSPNTRLIITVGIAKHHGQTNQLLTLMKFLYRMKLVHNSAGEQLIVIHFDPEFKQARPGTKQSKKFKDIEEVNTYFDDRLIFDPWGAEDLDYEGDPLTAEQKALLDSNLFLMGNSIHLFVPHLLVTHYSDRSNPFQRREFAYSKKQVQAYAQGCPPVKDSTYDALLHLMKSCPLKEMYVYNCAYWLSNVPIYNATGAPKGMASINENEYFEQLCELLNLLVQAGDSVKRYLLDSEFYRLSGQAKYKHKEAKHISIPSPYESLLTVFPFNATTTFEGGRKTRRRKGNRKTRKQRVKRKGKGKGFNR